MATGLAALCLGAPMAHAQSSSVPYSWASGWSSGFGGNLGAAESATVNGESAGFANNSAGVGAFVQRYSFSSNSFIGGGIGTGGLGLSGLGQSAAFGSSYSYDGATVGYNFKNSPISIYAGFDTAKYNPGLGANPFSPFDTTSNGTPSYTARAGVEFKPTSNLSLSVGASFTQAGSDNGINNNSAAIVPGVSPFARR